MVICDKNTYLWGEVSDMRLLFLQNWARDKDREIAVFDAEFLDLFVEPATDRLPDRIGPRPQDVATAHVVVFNHLSFGDNLTTVTFFSTRKATLIEIIIHTLKCWKPTNDHLHFRKTAIREHIRKKNDFFKVTIFRRQFLFGYS